MTDNTPLRLMIFDDTCRGKPLRPGLTHSWIAGALLYVSMGRLNRIYGANSWRDALRWLATIERKRTIAEIQFWGHGKWGNARVDGNILDISALHPSHEYYPLLMAIRERLIGPQALWWFRTCETFGADAGHRFATEWTNFFNCRTAGHTYIIGPWQSGLHCLSPGESPDWPTDEGIAEGTSKAPRKALWSKRGEPNTISCLHNRHKVLELT